MPDFDWLTDRNIALTVPCTYCGAPAGQPCVLADSYGKSLPLQHFPAHQCRITRARKGDDSGAESEAQ